MDFDLADFAVSYAQKKGASYAEARAELVSNDSFLLKNGAPEINGFSISSGIGVRFIAAGRMGFVTTNLLDKAKIMALIDKGVGMVQQMGPLGEDISFSDERAETASYEVKQKIKFDDVSAKEKLALLLDCEKVIKKTGVSVPGRQLFFANSTSEKLVVNSNGSRIFSKIPRTNFYYYVTVESNSRLGQRFWQYGYTGGFDMAEKADFPSILKKEVSATKKNLDNGVKPPTEAADVVVGPQVVGIMVHESIGHPYEADRIFGREGAQAGESFVTADMMGERIALEQVNIAEDPLIEGSFGHYLYDDEGVKARKRMLVKSGKINEFMHNKETAFRMGLKSNGSARAVAFDKEPIVRMANTFLEPGSFSDDELVADTRKGVYIANFMEWNIDDKRFNQKYTGAEAYLIRNGRIAEPVFCPTIEITTPKLWKSVDGIAKNVEYHAGTCGKGEPMQAIPVWFGGPAMRLKGIRLS